jgi:glutamyl-tRNA synthetase
MPGSYRGRLAPSPTGFLHLGHARTFWTAAERARAAGGTLILRDEDLDASRSRPEFSRAMVEDLRWLGLDWQEGPDRGGPCGPYVQSERRPFYLTGWERLRESGLVYPCYCSRQDVRRSLQAPHAGEEEPIYPGTCRPAPGGPGPRARREGERAPNWRFAVPAGEAVEFEDGGFGRQRFVAGKDFGDFVVWRHDGAPSYQLAVVLDDHAMGITEVVRGADLLLSTARQLLLYKALGWAAPAFYHCPLVANEAGVRLAKREDSASLRHWREQGLAPAEVREIWRGRAAGT